MGIDIKPAIILLKNIRTFQTISLILFCGMGSVAIAQVPDWAEDAAPILYKNCGSCHVQGGIAPFSLIGFDQAKAYGASIKSSVLAKRMPPWPPDPQYQRLAHERLLSSEEIKTLVDWIDGGYLKGDSTKAPAAPTPITTTQLTNTNLVLKMPNYLVNTGAQDEYRCFVLPTQLLQDEYLTAFEVIPGNRKIVHHVLVFQDTSTRPLQLDQADPNPGYLGYGGTGSSTSKLVGAYTPGQLPMVFPNGFGAKFEKGSYVIIQVHYPAYIQNQIDSTKVFLKTTKNNLREIFITPVLNHATSLTNGPLFIPANTTREFTGRYTSPLTVTLLGVFPHMHQVGTRIQSYGVQPNGDTIKFFNIPKWDFHWQGSYLFRKAMRLPFGTKLESRAFYDNTTSNPSNPNQPPKAVSAGEGTSDEMMLIYFMYAFYQTGDEQLVIDSSAPKTLNTTLTSKSNSVIFYPNPGYDKIMLKLKNQIDGKAEIWIHEIGGKACLKQEMVCKEGEGMIDISALHQGCFLVQVFLGNNIFQGIIFKAE